MKAGDMFVLDEINLAEDAVIERLNSVLESGIFDTWLSQYMTHSIHYPIST